LRLIRAHSDVFQQFVVERRKKVEALLLPAGDGRRADWEGKAGVQIGKREGWCADWEEFDVQQEVAREAFLGLPQG
jgi:hypothetical protein